MSGPADSATVKPLPVIAVQVELPTMKTQRSDAPPPIVSDAPAALASRLRPVRPRVTSVPVPLVPGPVTPDRRDKSNVAADAETNGVSEMVMPPDTFTSKEFAAMLAGPVANDQSVMGCDPGSVL